MDAAIIGAISFVLLILLICFTEIPVAYALGLLGIAGMACVISWPDALNNAALKFHTEIGAFSVTAVPLFLLMGYFAMHAGITSDAFAATQIWLRGLPGGLASATVVASALFSACAGSGLPAAAALGRIAVPEMLKVGYDRRLATGVVAAATPLAVLIPPSIVMVIFGILTETSIARLLIAGIIPGLLSAIIFIGAITLWAWWHPEIGPPVTGSVSWGMRFKVFRRIWGILALFALVMGSIYLGWATPTEAAGFGAFGTFIIGLANRKLRWKEIKEAVREGTIVSALTMFIVAMSAIYSVFLVRSGLVSMVATWLTSAFSGYHPVILLIVLSLFFSFLGMFLDSLAIMVITVPVFYPAVVAMGINLVWFGIIMVIWVEIAAITPPFGISVYALKGGIGDMVDLWDIFRGCIFFIVLWIVILAIILAFPEIALWLPSTIKGSV